MLRWLMRTVYVCSMCVYVSDEQREMSWCQRVSFSSPPLHPRLSTLNALYPYIPICVILSFCNVPIFPCKESRAASYLRPFNSLTLPCPFPRPFDPAPTDRLFNNRIFTLFHPLLLLLLSSPAPHSSHPIIHITNMFALRRAALPIMSLVKTTKHTQHQPHP